MAYIKKDRRDDEQRSPKREARSSKREAGSGKFEARGPKREAGSFERKPYNDKPERRASSSDRGDKKPFEARGPKREAGSYERKPYGDKPERRSSSSDRGDRREAAPYKKPYESRGDRPKPNERGSSYSDRPLRSSDEPRDRSGNSEKRGAGSGKFEARSPKREAGSYERKPYGDRAERKPYGERGDRKDSGDYKKPYGDRRESAPPKREVDRDGYKPRSKKTFDEKPSRGRPERRTKSDKITPHKPGAFDVFDKRYAKPNIKEEIKKERKEGRERKEENYRESRERRDPSAPLRDRGGERRGPSAPLRDREVRGEKPEVRAPRARSTERDTESSAAPKERVKREEVVEQYEGYDRKKTAPDEEIRLNKFIANSGVCSRRKADELIEKGEITVNGEVVRELGYKVKHTDKIKFEGKLLKPGKLVYVLLNKPKDYITTMDDPEERRTVVQLTAKATSERIFPVGRLDRNTTGLLLLTNDGDLADKLAHPRNQVKKVYEVELDKSLSTSDFEIIKNGVELEDGPAKPDQISFLEGKSKKFLGIEIHIGRNRIVRRIFESLGYEVVRLDRVIYAGLSKKDLPRGRHRMLTKEEIIHLKHLNKY